MTTSQKTTLNSHLLKKDSKPDLWLISFIFVVFVVHLFDSLYIRSHGDALNYHMYAPYNWARFGFLHVNLFQSTHFQGAWYEWFIWALFKIKLPVSLSDRESVLLSFQVLSCVAAYLVVPFLFYKNIKLSRQGKWLMICAYYACEMAMFTFQFAKNDAFAAAAFIFGAFSKGPLGMMFGLGLATGIKSTYLFGALGVLTLQYRHSQRREILLMSLGVLFFPLSVWIRNYLATGNWVFPLPSANGLQTSTWLREYFYQFSKPAPSAFFDRMGELFRTTPLYAVLCIAALALLLTQGLRNIFKIETRQSLFLFFPFVYLIVTGYHLEWRTFAGVLFVAVFYLVLFIDKNLNYKRSIIIPVLCLLGLASSKIDLASFTRFTSAHTKKFWELNRDGDVWHRANEILSDRDIVLSHLTNEGFFLIPQIYTLNEHPAREAILKAYPELDSYSNFIAVKTDGQCLGIKENENFVKPLLEKSSADLVKDSVNPRLYILEIKCAVST